jgi:crotonobetainyl-CoA:carnitine CoA-transferase CaiB-like acyl-CoA transferase
VRERILPNMPVRISNVAGLNYSMPPDLGRHNREIFGRLLGLSEAEIANLIEQRVIY